MYVMQRSAPLASQHLVRDLHAHTSRMLQSHQISVEVIGIESAT
jgi:hypothetical protein